MRGAQGRGREDGREGRDHGEREVGTTGRVQGVDGRRENEPRRGG